MAGPPSKPRVVRPSSVSGSEVANEELRAGAGRRFAIDGKGLLGSLLIHGCLIAAACTITFVDFGGAGFKGGSSSEGVDFQMSSAPQSSLSDLTSSRPRALPVLALRNPDSRILVPELADFPQLDPLVEKTTGVKDNLPSSLESSLGGSLGIAPSPGKDSPAGAGKRTGKSKGLGNGQASAGKTRVAPPKLLSSPAPRYPSSAKSNGKSGKVAVLIRVRGDGTASSAKVYHGSGHSELDQAAVNAARSWTFSKTPSLAPAETIDVVVQVNFSL